MRIFTENNRTTKNKSLNEVMLVSKLNRFDSETKEIFLNKLNLLYNITCDELKCLICLWVVGTLGTLTN